ncbi:ABC transporter ATP-binding protein [Microbacterium tumbae]
MSGSGGFVRDLSIVTGHGGVPILDGVDVEIAPGTIVGLAGETGSGKSTVGLSLLGHLGPGLVLQEGVAMVAAEPVLDASAGQLSAGRLRSLRGRLVSYVPQDPGTALNPGMRVGVAFAEVLRAHGHPNSQERRESLFETVGLPTGRSFARRYPHELSGGQQQRVAIAIAFALNPALVVMDEPTTGLDVATKQRVVGLVRRLAVERDAGILFISHDLPLLTELADRIVVMRAGRVLEEVAASAMDAEAAAPYTRRLLAALPAARPPRRDQPSGSPVLRVRGVSASHGKVEVTHEVDFEVAPGQCVAVVGESGSGKTTTAQSIAGLHRDFRGEIVLGGVSLAHGVAARTQDQRRQLQYVFQNPWGALNPRRTIGASIALSARRLLGASSGEAKEMTLRSLAAVGLRDDHADSLPQRLSGGQRQRAALARALVVEPTVLVCDEVTSSLDLSVQAEVVDLLVRLQEERKMAMVFITHDLALATAIAHETLVLKDGVVVECGPTPEVLARPAHPYTRQLVNAGHAVFRVPEQGSDPGRLHERPADPVASS